MPDIEPSSMPNLFPMVTAGLMYPLPIGYGPLCYKISKRRALMNFIQDRRILVIDDDPGICELLRHILDGRGAQVSCAIDGTAGLAQFHDFHPDLVILDVMMPGMDGFDLCKRILGKARVPVIFLSARGQDPDIIAGLGCGAVDYVAKPFSNKVLVARVEAALRQAQSIGGYRDAYLTVDVVAHLVLARGERVALTPLEWQLLLFFVENPNRTLSYAEILRDVWGPEYEDCLHYVHVHVSRLRSKLEMDPRMPRYIHTERSVGYRFSPPVVADRSGEA